MPRWLLACLIAVGIWGVWGLVFASASAQMSPLLVHILTTIGLTPIVAALYFSKKEPATGNRTRGIIFGLATGLCGSLGNVAVSVAFTLGGEASVVSPMTAIFPLVALILSMVFFHERLNVNQGVGILIALGAILLFSRVDDGAVVDLTAALVSPWMLSAFVALILYGIAGLTQKLSTNDISDELSTICYWGSCIFVAAVILATQPLDWSLPASAWVLALTAGALMGLALWIGFAAYRGGKASIVTALIALYPAITVALAIPILGESMNVTKIAAITCALLAGLALTFERSTLVAAPAPSDG